MVIGQSRQQPVRDGAVHLRRRHLLDGHPPGAAATIANARIPRSRVCDPAFFGAAGTAASAGTASRSVISVLISLEVRVC